MKIGYGRVNITPSKPFYLLGYKTPKRNQPAEGIHDPIFINAILFQNHFGQESFLATGDLLEIEDSVATDIRQRLSYQFQIPFDNIIIGVTHDHHSVRDFHQTWEFGEFSQDYYDFFVEKFLQVFQQCRENLADAQIEYGQKKILGYYSNRNHKGCESDNLVSVVTFKQENKAVAGIVNVAVHSTVLSGDNMLLTADLAGNLSTKLAEKWGFYPLMLIGCAADSSNRFDRQGRDFAELDRVTSALAADVASITVSKQLNLDGNIDILIQNLEIASNKENYDISLRKTITELEQGKKTVGDHSPTVLIRKCSDQLKQPPFRDALTLQILDIGELRFFVFPGELASAGAEILRNSTDKTVLIAGYCNGFHYYFLPKEDYGLSFETIGNPIPAGTFEQIIEKFTEGSHLLDASHQ